MYGKTSFTMYIYFTQKNNNIKQVYIFFNHQLYSAFNFALR